MLKIERCVFSGLKIYPQRGVLFIRADAKIFRFVGPAATLESVEAYLAHIKTRLHSAEAAELKESLRELVPEYSPYRGG